jgi:hypothetical protein
VFWGRVYLLGASVYNMRASDLPNYLQINAGKATEAAGVISTSVSSTKVHGVMFRKTSDSYSI